MGDLPDVELEELENAIGIVPVGSDDVQVVMGCSSDGPELQLGAYGTVDGLVADFGHGPAVEAAALSINETGTPVIFCRLPSSVSGVLGTLDDSGVTGSSVVTATGVPFDTLDLYLICRKGGILGTDEIRFQWSRDNGRNLSAETLLPSTGSTVAGSITSDAGSFPVALAHGDTFIGKVDQQVSADTLTISATAASTTGSGATYAAVTAGHTLTLTLSGAQYVVTFTGSEATQAAFHATINGQISASGFAANAGGQTKISTNRKGSGASGSIDAGDADVLASLGLSVAAFSAGTGNVANVVAVTAAEFAGLLTSTFTGGTAGSTGTAIGTDRVKWASDTAGESPNGVQFTGGTGVSKIAGFDLLEHNGSDVDYSFPIPNSGVTLHFAPGTLNTGDVVLLPTTEPKFVSQDVTDAFAVLKESQQSWGFIQIVGPMSRSMANVLGTALDSLWSDAKFRGRAAIISTRNPNVGESNAAWRAAIKAEFNGWTRTDVMICAGSWWQNSAVKAQQYVRPIAPAVAAHAVSRDFWIDLAKVRGGVLTTGTLFDSNGTLIGHDERVNPDLDKAGFCTLRTFSTKGQAVYITNPRLHSQAGSDFDYWQKRRVMNVLEAAVYDTSLDLTLSAEGDTDEQGHVSETAARDIEHDMREAITTALGPAISNPGADELFVLSRTDPVLTNGGELNASSRARPLFYIKKLKVKVGFTAGTPATATEG